MTNIVDPDDSPRYQPEPEPEPEVESFKQHEKNIKTNYETDSDTYYDSDISELQPVNDDIFNINLIEIKNINCDNRDNREIKLENKNESEEPYEYYDIENQILITSTIHKYSSALDILASYLKGQKTLYNEARILHNKYLNYCMIPCIFMSSVCTVLTQINFNIQIDKSFIVSTLNALITCVLAFINYLKLDASAESYKISSNQYEKIQKTAEFISGEILLFSNPYLDESNLKKNEQILNKVFPIKSISDEQAFYKKYYQRYNYEESKMTSNLKLKVKDIKDKIIEIKDNSQFPIPHTIQKNFQIIYNTNIFSIIKKIDDHRNNLMFRFNYYKNKLEDIKKNKEEFESSKYTEVYKKNIIKMNEIIKQILFLKTAHTNIDVVFQQEILNYIIRKKYWLRFIFIDTFVTCMGPTQKCILYPKDYKEPNILNENVYNFLFK